MLTNCEVCGAHVSTRPLFRVNPKGEDARMRCAECLENPLPKDLKDLTDAIRGEETDG